MGLYGTETETGFSKQQFRFFQPEPEYFLTIPVPVETEPEFQIFILVPAKPEPEIDFCRNSAWNMYMVILYLFYILEYVNGYSIFFVDATSVGVWLEHSSEFFSIASLCWLTLT